MAEQPVLMKTLIEVPLAILFFAMLLMSSVTGNLVIFRTCYTILNYNITDCALLGKENKSDYINELEKLVEPDAAKINMVRSLVEGTLIQYLIFAVLSALPNLSPWYFMLTTIPMILTGGIATYITIALSFVTDITSESNRGIRMGSFQASIILGMLLGTILSSYLFYATSYTVVYLVCAFCIFLALLYTIFFLPESLVNRETENRFKGFFQLKNIIDMCKTTFKQRPNYDRFVIVSCLLLVIIYLTIDFADSTITFLFLREKFYWSLKKFTLFSSASNIGGIIGVIIGVYLFNKLLKIPETLLIIIGLISALNGALLQGLAPNDSFIYFAAGVRSLAATISPMIRSLISKIVPAEEIGKVFCLFITTEMVFTMAGPPIYTEIYTATINTDPEFYNFVTATFIFLALLISIIITVIRTFKPVVGYTELTEDGEATQSTSNHEDIRI